MAGLLALRRLSMASSGSQIILSLFDRLTDENPRASVDAPQQEWERMSAFKRGVARDLTHLLNTRINENDIPEEYEQARTSMLAFGVQDYTRSPVEQDDIRRSIERAIRNFEPRLTRVQVQLVSTGVLELQFRISAYLKADL